MLGATTEMLQEQNSLEVSGTALKAKLAREISSEEEQRLLLILAEAAFLWKSLL